MVNTLNEQFIFTPPSYPDDVIEEEQKRKGGYMVGGVWVSLSESSDDEVDHYTYHSLFIHDFRPPPEGIKIPIGNDPFDCFLAPSSLDISEDESASGQDSSDSDQFINITAITDSDCFNSEDT